MIETRSGAKYIEKDPPMEEQGQGIIRKILDYLAYLKESLNFVFSTYGKRLVDASGNINELIRTAEETTSRIENAEGNISIISQKANKIEMVVGTDAAGNDYIKAASIVMAINNDTSSIQISADHIDLTGYVTMTDLSTGGRTEINGANITTGYINADRIAANSISVAKLTGSISNNNWVIDLNAGTLTLGNISADNINTGTLNAALIAANSIAVSKLTGKIENGNWKIDLDEGTLTVGNISADNIKGGYISSDVIDVGTVTAEKITGVIQKSGWGIDFTNGEMIIGNISANKIKGGYISADVIEAKSINVDRLNGSVSSSSGGWSVSFGDTQSFTVGTLDASHINTGTLDAGLIAAGSITTEKLAANAVTAEKINAGAVTANKINAGAVTAEKIGAGAITAEKIYSGAVTADKIETGAVTAEKIGANAVTAGKIDAGAVTAEKIATGAVTAEKIYTAAVTADKIDTGAITTDKIYAGAITADKINLNDLFSKNITASNFNITGGSINVTTSDKDTSVIELKYGNMRTKLSPAGLKVSNQTGSSFISAGYDGLNVYSGDTQIFNVGASSVNAVVTNYGNLGYTGQIREGLVTTTTVPTGGTATEVASIILGKGRYIIVGAVSTLSSVTGFRMAVSTSNNTTSTGAIAEGDTLKHLRVVDILNVSEETTYYLTAQHSTGSNRTVSWALKAMRIS